MPLKYQKCDWAKLTYEETKVLEKVRQKYILHANDASFLKDKILTELNLNMNIKDPSMTKAIKIYNVWKKGIARMDVCIDYMDMVTGTMELIAQNEKLKNLITTKYDLVIIDEVQDFNTHFLSIIDLVSPQNIITAGDSHQTINMFSRSFS